MWLMLYSKPSVVAHFRDSVAQWLLMNRTRCEYMTYTNKAPATAVKADRG